MIFWYLWIIKNKIRIIFSNKLIHLICYIKGVKIGQRIEIGNNCSFNSAKNSVLIGLLRPCTFVTLEQDSEIVLGNNVGISGGIVIAASKIEIGNNVLIGANCTILDTDFHHTDPQRKLTGSPSPSRPVIIKGNVFIGANSIILKGVTIGQNSVIGAGSVVFNDIPDNSIAIGNPCKVVIRKRIDIV
jgi:acetyltransferase-like isoleucine patch superfamily enzyme